MPEYTTAYRLKQIMSTRDIKQVDILRLAKPFCDAYKIKLGRNDLSQYVSGKVKPGQSKLYVLAKALNVNEAWLMGCDVPMERNDDYPLPPPIITEDYTTFPVIGEVAAGYEHIAIENWEGDFVEVPNSYLKGRNKEDFFVLRVKGDSMYPDYKDGDKVLVLKQSTLNYSGQVGVVVYGDDHATLKKVEYKQGEDWMNLIAINPTVPPTRIENEALEHCKVLGIPKLILRELEEY